MTVFTHTFDEALSLSESFSFTSDFLFTEEVIGNLIAPYATLIYLENQKAIDVSRIQDSAVIFQNGEKIEWIGYGGLQNIRRASIEADFRVDNGFILNGTEFTADQIIATVIDAVEVFDVSPYTINGDKVLYVKLKNGANLLKQERGMHFVEFLFEVGVVSNKV